MTKEQLERLIESACVQFGLLIEVANKSGLLSKTEIKAAVFRVLS